MLNGTLFTPSDELILKVALYNVVAVIVVICAIIVTLAITIVILYCKKGTHSNSDKTAGMSVLAF